MEQHPLKLIVGLGNPGPAYADSRHNVGFQCLNLLAKKEGIEFAKQQSKAKIGKGEVLGHRVILAKPRTYMNLSGTSVASLMHYYKIEPADLVVIYDDVDLPLGKIRIRERGGAGGHNGIKSIIQNLGTQDFPRIRVGIGSLENLEMIDSPQPSRTPQYVLGRFTAEEKPIIEEVRRRVVDALCCILTDGIAAAMNRYNPG